MGAITIPNTDDAWEETEGETQPLIPPIDVNDSTKAETYAQHYANIYENGPAGQALNTLGMEPKVTYTITPNESGGSRIDFQVKNILKAKETTMSETIQ